MVVLRRLLVVLAVAGAGLAPAPAIAAGYCSGSGVNVVVDFGALGGGIQKGCDASGNRNAAQAFRNAGHTLTPVQSQPAFVCRIDGLPAPEKEACATTPPADAYWGLYWSDGTSGWKYASVAVGSLTVPAGATVAFSWQNGGGDPPGTAPAPLPAAAPPSTPASSPRPTRTPTVTTQPKATTTHTSAAAPTSRAATPSATPSVSGSPSATATVSSTSSVSATPTASASDTPTAAASASPPAAAGPSKARLDAASDSGGGLPWWLPLGSIVALAGIGGVVWQVRRARP